MICYGTWIKIFYIFEMHSGYCPLLVYCVTSIYAVWHIGIALSSHFVASSLASSVIGVCRHTFYSGKYLKNGLSDLIQI